MTIGIRADRPVEQTCALSVPDGPRGVRSDPVAIRLLEVEATMDNPRLAASAPLQDPGFVRRTGSGAIGALAAEFPVVPLSAIAKWLLIGAAVGVVSLAPLVLVGQIVAPQNTPPPRLAAATGRHLQEPWALSRAAVGVPPQPSASTDPMLPAMREQPDLPTPLSPSGP